jgi:hypothetical protein
MNLSGFDLRRYDEHTEGLIAFVLARVEADDLLASGLPRWWRIGHLRTGQWHSLVSDYREAVRNAAADDLQRWVRLMWLVIARYHGFLLRMEARPYKHREGFNCAWLRAPRRRP